jgi:hypothetical protein
VLQKTLDDLRVVHESTVLRLEKAEAKIHEMENAKVEKLDVDLMDVLTKPISHKGWIHDTVIDADGFSYVRMNGTDGIPRTLKKSGKE